MTATSDAATTATSLPPQHWRLLRNLVDQMGRAGHPASSIHIRDWCRESDAGWDDIIDLAHRGLITIETSPRPTVDERRTVIRTAAGQTVTHEAVWPIATMLADVRAAGHRGVMPFRLCDRTPLAVAAHAARWLAFVDAFGHEPPYRPDQVYSRPNTFAGVRVVVTRGGVPYVL